MDGKLGNYTHSMYLDDEGLIAAVREIWGFPKKLAGPQIGVNGNDTLLGTLDYGTQRLATGMMGYNRWTLDMETEHAKLADRPNYLLKVLPHVDGTSRVCEQVRFFLRDVTVLGAWARPAALELRHHALAPVADLPVQRAVGARQVLADLTHDIGDVAFDYLANTG
jgi:acetoacetate decarboxylase